MDTLIDAALQNIAALTGGVAGPDSGTEALSRRVAKALGWDQESARLDPIEVQIGGLKLELGFLGPQPAALFAADGTNAGEPFLSDAARFAYHSSVHWGLIIDGDGAVLFNSHWIRGEDWFRLPRIGWADVDAHHEVLRAMTPKGVAAGRLDQLAAQIYPPDRFLTPVDDALVERLDHWRREALRYGRAAENLDEDLHTLFAQLFVLRAVEDRGLAPSVPRLGDAVSESRVNTERFREVFARARKVIQSELFADDPLGRFPEFVLAGIVNDLYIPSQLPRGAQRYNFAWIDADVLGRAYEKYLSTVYSPVAPSPQLRLFDQPLRELQPVSVRKSAGVYYTPNYLVATLSEEALNRIFDEHAEPNFIPRIADFACGSGSFLVAAVSGLLRRLRERDPGLSWARRLIEGKYVVGIDLDPGAVMMSRMNLWIRLTDEPDALPLPSIEEVVVHGDSLGKDVWESLPADYDVVLGNPPFIATGSLESREELERRFRTAQGRFDYAHLFVEVGIDHLTPGGILSMVVPNRLFRNRDAGPVRRILTTDADLLGVIDFGANEVFEGTSAYIGTIIARKRGANTALHPLKTRVVLVSHIPNVHYLSGLLLDALNTNGEVDFRGLTGFEIPHPSGEGAWVLLSPGARRSRLLLEQDAVPLGEFAGVFQGIRTGANDIFILRLESTDGPLARVVNGLGDSAILETALLHPVVFGSDIQRYDALRPERMLLYPYRRGLVLSEVELMNEYSAVYAYLDTYRDLLSGRSSIASSGLRWYELVRKRDETWLLSQKLLTRDLATRTSFTVDDQGQVFLVGGTAVVPPDPAGVLPLLAYLNSSVASAYLVELTPTFRGSFQKFEPQHLAQLPVPKFLIDLDDTGVQIGELAREVLEAQLVGQEEMRLVAEETIDRIVVAAVGFGR